MPRLLLHPRDIEQEIFLFTWAFQEDSSSLYAVIRLVIPVFQSTQME